MIKLFVDDKRDGPEHWLVVRTISEAINILMTMDVEEVSLDHDTGYVIYRFDRNLIFAFKNYLTHGNKGFLEFLIDWLSGFYMETPNENYCSLAYIIRTIPTIKRVWVHSSNSTAYIKVSSLLNGVGIEVKKGFPNE